MASLLQTMGVDARVEFAASEAPVDRGLAESAIRLADAFARGDDEALRQMLDKGDQQMLDQLMASEQWWDETDRIEAVRVVSIDAGSRLVEGPQSTQVMLAVQDPDGAYLLGWSGRKVFEDWVFSAVPSNGEERARASAWDGMSPMAGGMGGMDAMLAGNPELQAMMTKALTAMESLPMEELLKLKAMIEAMEPAPPGMLEMIEQEIAKREKRDTGSGGSGGGSSGDGGGGDDRQRDPGPGGPG
ncbi:hypothetical protein MNBD_PLANCTO03-1177 [hydrothermal vent metagenome]|uniref:Uncharacterized protein n=1 Tax=hydrothermal vent metagenome TaxID=652676 RepID=A0A3B1DX69_9ZZZZ